MKANAVLLALLSGLCTCIFAENTNSFSATQVLLIDQTSIPVSAGGKATLSISPLRPSSNTYAGDYHMKVSPYFFKSEHGKLSMSIPDECFAKVAKGLMTEVSGTATSQDGQTRYIHAEATPLDKSKGTLKLWFLVGERKMVFNTMYHLQ